MSSFSLNINLLDLSPSLFSSQVTLDRVWPVDKSTKSHVKSPEKLESMNYEEKLQKACIKLGARFIEFRPETGSWVFKVRQ